MEETRTPGLRSFADGVGIAGSAICALHCVGAPLLLVAGTAVPASFLSGEQFHQLLLWGTLPASALAFGLGCWQHKDPRVLALGILGLLGLSASVVAHDWVGEGGERALTLASAGILIAGHLLNFRRCRDTGCDHETEAHEAGAG
ncbi:MAG: MerC domain-containing protein [Myxococcota bacterium]